MPKKTDAVPAAIMTAAKVEMASIEAEIAALVNAGRSVPRTLELKMLYCLARVQDDPKEKKETYRQIALLRERDAKKGITVADVPKAVLMKIAGFRAKGLTPYAPAME